MLTFKFNKDNTACVVTDCDQNVTGTVTIPDTYSGKDVVGIGKDAFNGCKNMTDVIIPDSIKKIGNRAFSFCTGLTNIVIPDSVKTAGEGIFISCTSLKSVVLSYGISAERI